MTSNLDWLQQFYLSLCDGEWEHSYGCTIENLDNPGWMFKFELADTPHENRELSEISLGPDRDGDGPDWLFLRKVGSTVEGACGPLKLDETIGQFRNWVESDN